MSIAELPHVRACADPAGHCLADDSTRLGNREFARRVEVASAVLRDRGVTPGVIVAVCLPNCVELVVTIFAAWRLGAAVTPVNPALTAEEARYQVEDAGAVVVIAADDRPGSVDVRHLSMEAAGHPVPEPVPSAERDLALVIYTSGTTGRPKGVVLDHGNVNAMARMIIDGLDLTAGDHSLLILPLFHVNGIVVSILAPLLAGGQATMTGRFSATSFFDLVERVRPTYFSAVPAIYAMLVAQPADRQCDMSSLRLVVCGAAPMPAELIGRFESRFGVPVVEGYGLSEGTCASTLNPLAGPRKPGTVGRPLAGQTVAVLGPDGQVRNDGAPGEVVVRGPNVMRGYLGQPTATAETIVDGWLRTGDVGYFDNDGYLVLVDRIKDLIIRGGENIYPKEIENTLHSHPAVLEAAVVGMADPILGEVPVAHVVAVPGAAVADIELLEHCRGRLAKVKVPVAVHLTGALPRNPVGKVDKKALRALIATG